ncbi:hypothetical protein [Streptomyces sp. NPDC088923]|uniref:hypothetical protein n=1 Tax=Streptomyces sp. NPDC088923 TaxID=3365913 RepID=UPI003814218B
MAALAWLLIPLVAAVGAGLWAMWANRTRRTGDGPELAGYEKFRAAMEKQGTERAAREEPAEAAWTPPLSAGRAAREEPAESA